MNLTVNSEFERKEMILMDEGSSVFEHEEHDFENRRLICAKY